MDETFERIGVDGVRERVGWISVESVIARECVVCGAWFAVAPGMKGTLTDGNKRGDARYDTNACRAKAYRQRKRRDG